MTIEDTDKHPGSGSAASTEDSDHSRWPCPRASQRNGEARVLEFVLPTCRTTSSRVGDRCTSTSTEGYGFQLQNLRKPETNDMQGGRGRGQGQGAGAGGRGRGKGRGVGGVGAEVAIRLTTKLGNAYDGSSRTVPNRS